MYRADKSGQTERLSSCLGLWGETGRRVGGAANQYGVLWGVMEVLWN